MSDELDLVVLGSGVAGLSAAVRAAGVHGLRTGVVTKGGLDLATTRWAQGGVAAALSGDSEEIDLHLADTVAAGAGLCDVDAVRVLVDEGPRRVEELIALGAEFDRDAAGNLELAREGGHSVARVLHAGGAATGAEIERALVAAVHATAAVVHEHTFAVDLAVRDGRCSGVVVAGPDGRRAVIGARHVLLATGGAGQLFEITTNPAVATGDGVAMALRAGVAVADLEFFQFHPTALHHPAMPRPLLSEALRGHGALLRDAAGERFVDELLPRDVVARAILSVMTDGGAEHVWLDATGLERFDLRFPTIHADLAAVGLDPRTDWLPVAPAAHHQCGGILTDLAGATSLPGLWAAGETACTGVHGANRLASNSLLEGMVFGPRAIEAVADGVDGPRADGAMRPLLERAGGPAREGPGAAGSGAGSAIALQRLEPAPRSVDHAELRGRSSSTLPGPDPESGPAPGATPGEASVRELRAGLQHTMSVNAGVLRSEERLAEAAAAIEVTAALASESSRSTAPEVLDTAAAELDNLVAIARVLVAAARARTESRGTHARSDRPELDPAQTHRLVLHGA